MRFVRLSSCKEGMIIGRNVYGNNGMILLRAGNPVKQNHIDTLLRLGYLGIYVEDAFSKGIDMKEVVIGETRNAATTTIQELFSKSKFIDMKSTALIIEQIQDILGAIVDQILSNRDSVINILSLKSFDNYTYQHCADVGILSVILGLELKIQRRKLLDLGKAAFFHDIGKMFVRQEILNKPSKLTPEEFEEVKKHTELGYIYVKNVLNQPDRVCNGALFHHERYSGGGYPNNVSGNDIPFFAKIIAIADAYDTIISKRVYKEAMLASEAYEYIMGNVGTHFDPTVAGAFLRKIAPFPVGTCVRLSNGRPAIVVENRASFMMRPVVKLLKDNLADPDVYIDLAYDSFATSVTITETL